MTRRQGPPGGRRFALVLGGGGTHGLAHVGALAELESRGWAPTEVIGCSIGALIGAAWASGFSTSDIESMALSLQRQDIFQLARADMAFKRLRSPALYKSEPLQDLVYGLLGDVTFAELPRRVIVASVEINAGMLVYWGLPGLDHVRVADAVIASCSLPGFFAPREIEGRHFVDGAIIDNLPVRLAASRGHETIVAVDVSTPSALRSDVQSEGFASVYARATEIVFQQAMERHLGTWSAPPMLLVQPRVEHIPMFSFHHVREMIAEGRRAAALALEQSGDVVVTAKTGIYPQRKMSLNVLRERCIGCGACVSLAPPGTFHLGPDGKAVPPQGPVLWSPVDGSYLRHCPTWAITAHPTPDLQGARASTGGASTGTAPAPS